jgi:hypothetical protein
MNTPLTATSRRSRTNGEKPPCGSDCCALLSAFARLRGHRLPPRCRNAPSAGATSTTPTTRSSFGVKKFAEVLAAKSGGKLKPRVSGFAAPVTSCSSSRRCAAARRKSSRRRPTSLAGVVKDLGLFDFPFTVSPRPISSFSGSNSSIAFPNAPWASASACSATGGLASATPPTAADPSRSSRISPASSCA